MLQSFCEEYHLQPDYVVNNFDWNYVIQEGFGEDVSVLGIGGAEDCLGSDDRSLGKGSVMGSSVGRG